jgi:OOP family OmpA-OmpF porin
MKSNIKFKQLLTMALISSAVALTACSSSPKAPVLSDTLNPRAEVAQLETEMQAEVKQQVDVLSPHHFGEAQEALSDAKKGLEKQHDAKDILKDVAEARAHVKESKAYAELAHNNIESVITARRRAIDAGALSTLSSDFRTADSKLKDVTSDIEKNKLNSAMKNRSALQLRYLDLELRAIKIARTGKAKETIELAKKEGAKDLAPRSLAIAEKSVLDTDAYITLNRRDSAQLDARSAQAMTHADHLLKITRDAKMGKKVSAEDAALQMESEQNKVTAKEQELNLSEAQLAAKQKQVNQKDQSIHALSAQNSSLESDQAFNQKFEEARREFTKSEAEVYKQGNTLVIRLRSLEFPSSQAVLKGSNFPLLAKVQKVIQNFDKSSIIVEGHTDSIGSKEINEKLSTERAQAVREYLVSNANGSDTAEITAVGYGYQKPLATNKTANGRAQNRRVDILIQPVKSENL